MHKKFLMFPRVINLLKWKEGKKQKERIQNNGRSKQKDCAWILHARVFLNRGIIISVGGQLNAKCNMFSERERKRHLYPTCKHLVYIVGSRIMIKASVTMHRAPKGLQWGSKPNLDIWCHCRRKSIYKGDTHTSSLAPNADLIRIMGSSGREMITSTPWTPCVS